MALEGITVAVGDLIVGIVMLIIGGVMLALNNQLQRPYNLILIIGGLSLAVLGVVVIILAFV